MPNRSGALLVRLGVMIGLMFVVFAELQAWVRTAELWGATRLVQLSGVCRLGLSSGASVVVTPSSHQAFRVVVSQSCSSLASVLAIGCLAVLAPHYGSYRKAAAFAASMFVIVAGNVLRIAGSLGVGLVAGRSSLVLFHDSIGNIFSFAYTLGGYILLLWLLLLWGRPGTRKIASAPS